jgi:hypothetical protein
LNLVLALSSFVLAACGTAPSPAENHGPMVASGGAGGGAGASGLIPVGVGGGCVVMPEPMPSDGGMDPICASVTEQVAFQTNVLPIVHCSGEACHQAWTYATLVGHASSACCDHRPLVSPGWPSSSHLYQAVTGVNSCVGQMGALNDAQIAAIAAWICEGAPND